MPARQRVLIVEDEDILAANLHAYLEKGAWEACIAADGASAIALADAFAPDVVVLDYRLPDMSGFEVFDAMRTRVPFSCVLMTGYANAAVLKGAAARGIEDVLFKPFALNELSVAICNACRRCPGPVGADGAALRERRQRPCGDFPLRLFDGTWIHADRRRPATDSTDPEPDPEPGSG